VLLSFTPTAVGRVFNVGSCEEISILRLAERILEKAREHLVPIARNVAWRGQIRLRS
jgi:hypothetical protein